MTCVKVASENSVKINAIKAAFNRFFNDDVTIISQNVKSGVPDQPINEDVFEGAKNRLRELKNGSEYNYLVSCEGGLLQLAEHWFNVQVVIIEDENGNQGIGLSQGYEIPSEYVEEAINTSVAAVLDRKFGGKGGISVLTRGHETRESLIKDGTVMALSRVLNSKIW